MKRHSVSGRNELLVSTATLIGCVSIANFAHAQSAPPSTKSAAQPPAGALEEVLVTAQRREERLQDVPISITALSAADIKSAGVTTNLDLTRLVPGLKMDRIAGFTNPAIRGVTTSISFPGADPNVATYIDGVYQSNPAAGTFDLPDIERIDVSKGPQGTLFGRNATGGAIQVFTLNPTNEFAAHLGYTYGSHNDQTLKTFISGPIVEDKVFASLSGFGETADSYYDNIGPGGDPNGISSYALRGKVIVQASEDLKFTFIGFVGQHGDSSSVLGSALNGISIGQNFPGSIVPIKPYDVAFNHSPKQRMVAGGGSAQVDYTSGLGVLTFTSSYNKSNAHLVVPTSNAFVAGDLSPYYYAQTPGETYNGELVLASVPYGPFSYIAGVNYYDDTQAYAPLAISTNGAGVTIFARQTSKAYSVFGEATFEITDRLSTIVGARYSEEKRNIYGNFYSSLNFGTEPPNGWVPQGEATFNRVTPRVSLRYETGPSSNVYFTYSEGFKSGLYDVASVPSPGVPASDGHPNLVEPEKLKAYEIGFKTAPSEWYSFNAAAFAYKYSNQQLASYHTVNNVPLGEITNAASSNIYGFEFEGTVKPTEDFTVHAGVSLLQPEFDSFPQAQVNTPRPPNNAGNVTSLVNASGNDLIRAPRWTASLSATYARDFEFGHVSVTGNVYHSDRIYYDVGNIYSQKPYTDLGLNAALQPAGFRGLTLSVYGTNLSDNEVIQGAFIQSRATAVSWAPPRAFGVGVAYDF